MFDVGTVISKLSFFTVVRGGSLFAGRLVGCSELAYLASMQQPLPTANIGIWQKIPHSGGTVTSIVPVRQNGISSFPCLLLLPLSFQGNVLIGHKGSPNPLLMSLPSIFPLLRDLRESVPFSRSPAKKVRCPPSLPSPPICAPSLSSITKYVLNWTARLKARRVRPLSDSESRVIRQIPSDSDRATSVCTEQHSSRGTDGNHPIT